MTCLTCKTATSKDRWYLAAFGHGSFPPLYACPNCGTVKLDVENENGGNWDKKAVETKK